MAAKFVWGLGEPSDAVPPVTEPLPMSTYRLGRLMMMCPTNGIGVASKFGRRETLKLVIISSKSANERPKRMSFCLINLSKSGSFSASTPTKLFENELALDFTAGDETCWYLVLYWSCVVGVLVEDVLLSAFRMLFQSILDTAEPTRPVRDSTKLKGIW